MAVDESIFPKGCYLGFTDDGKLSFAGNEFLKEQKLNDWKGQGAEQPCFGCRIDDCTVRIVQYHEVEKRYFVKPRGH